MSQPVAFLLHESLQFAAEKHPLKEAVVVEGVSHSYAELWDSVSRMAIALNRRGLQRGDRVAIYMDNTWPCVISIYAALLAGGVFLVINPQTKADKLVFIIRDSGARFLMTDAHLANSFLSVLDELPDLVGVICSGALIEHARVASFNSVLSEAVAGLVGAVNIPLDLAALIYTSGSTGNPKGVMQTHQSMLFAARSLIKYLRLSESDRILCVLPLGFDYGLYQLLMAIQLGATLILERSFTFPAQIFSRMETQKVTVFPGVPTIYAMLLSIHGRSPLQFPAVTRITNTAAALPDDFVPRLRAVFPNALIYRMYGLTECKRVSYLEPELADQLPGSVGKAIPGTEVYLLSPEGQPVKNGETGILYVRGPHVMLGYWQQPELTDRMLKPGKFPGERVLCTQDYFRMDEEGYLYFVGRNDDIIKSRGEKVSPVEVENAMHKIPGVREVAVVGVDDETLGQAVRAFVVLDGSVNLTDKQVRMQCMALMENYMVPRDIIFCHELPKTATGKVSKKLLIEQHPS